MTNLIEIRILDRSSFACGHAFEGSGPYERIRGRAYFQVDPDAPAQAGVFDIDKAPRNENGLVEFDGDFLIFKPIDPGHGNQRLFYDFGNRGNMRALQFFNDAPGSNDPITLADAGNGYLFRRGYTVVSCAWQGDLLPGNNRVLLNLPVATDGGKPLTGQVLQEFIVYVPGITTRPLSGWPSTRSHPVDSLDNSHARLTKRRYPYNDRIDVPRTEWSFARTEGGEGADAQGAEFGILPSETNIYMPKGFEPGWIYELTYTGRDPLVLGLGDVAVRDLVSFLRYTEKDAAGNPNPVGTIEKVYAWGRSQTGRLIRDFVYRGFNADAQNRQVFDGVLPHVSGGGLMWMHHRFAILTASAGQAYMEHFIYSDRFPFSYASCTDHLTGKTDAILKRPDTDPLVMHTQTATEYWERHGSLVHTDTRGNDLPQPENVRVYNWSSSMHFADPQQRTPVWPPPAAYRFNNVQTSFFFRAMIDAMDRWATDGTSPPESMIPSREDGTLITYEEWVEGFPKIPGRVLPPGPSALPLLDFGSDADDGLLTKLPPEIKDLNGYPILVPSVDADGNETAGVRSPMVQAPLGTYTGWNIRTRGWGHGASLTIQGSYIPFADTPEEQEITRDPRLSVLERYGSPENYVEAVRTAAERLVEAGLMLEEDIELVVAMAGNWGRPWHDVRL